MLKQITPDNFYTSKSPSSALTYSFPFVILCSLAVYTFTVIVFCLPLTAFIILFNAWG